MVGGIGGLVGGGSATITNSYATGMVTGNEGASHVGGLMGRKEGGVITNSFWDTQTTGQATSVGGGVGKTTAQMQTLSTFADWDIAGTDGAYPTLTLGGATIWTMSPINLSYSLSTQNHTYNGSIYNLADFWSASSIFGASYASWVLGTDYTFIYDSSSTTGFKNAGTYSNITIDILKSGYTEAGIGNTAGVFTIAQKELTISGITASNKTYDGLLTATVNTASVAKTGLIDGDTLTVSSSGVFTDKNAGTGKTVTLTNTYGGADVNNYAITDQTTTTADIAQKALTISGLVADNKIYDGTTSVVMTNWGSLSGLVGTETLTLGHGTASFENAEVGNSKTVTAIDYTLSDGDNGGVVGNYLLALNTATTTANITSVTPTPPAPTPQPNPQPTPQTQPDVSHIENGTASLVSTAFVQQMRQSPQAPAPVVGASGPLPSWGNGNIAIINGGVRLPDYVDQEETR